ncbi:hypothetical protein [Paraburkholderia ferrariae]|uniref:hypothetical protein n=1 Tax=Paraburkholderia ferrariae TaxID=386056 RepID=UPI00048559B6|nr:hypothetical protein [Paraburkholderia ferrariae]
MSVQAGAFRPAANRKAAGTHIARAAPTAIVDWLARVLATLEVPVDRIADTRALGLPATAPTPPTAAGTRIPRALNRPSGDIEIEPQ